MNHATRLTDHLPLVAGDDLDVNHLREERQKEIPISNDAILEWNAMNPIFTRIIGFQRWEELHSHPMAVPPQVVGGVERLVVSALDLWWIRAP